MNINVWKRSELSDEELTRILKRAEDDIQDVADIVKPIIEDVRNRGDAALIDYAAKFDKSEIKGGLKATDEDFEKAYQQLRAGCHRSNKALCGKCPYPSPTTNGSC